MPRMRLEPTISVFERAKTVHALDYAATVICTVTTEYNLFLKYETFSGSYEDGCHSHVLLLTVTKDYLNIILIP
jgi:hypothetical protein